MYYGADVLPYVIIYDQLGTFLALAIYGAFIVSVYSSNETFHVAIVLRKLFTFPPFVFLFVAFGLHGVEYSANIEFILQIFSFTIVPFALTAVGFQLQLKLPRDELLPFSSSLFIKLIISPLLAFLMCTMFALEGEAATVSIMEAGMAPMITAGAMASLAGLEPRLSNAIVGYGILLSFLTTYVLHLIL